MSEEGLASLKNLFVISSLLILFSAANCSTKVETPSEAVGPGKIELTVTTVHFVVSASRLETDS